MTSRREFLKQLGTAAASVTALNQTSLPAMANPLGMPIGFQGYDVRFLITRDWDKGWREMRSMGYQSVDLVSFKGYGYEHSPLANFTAKQIRDELDAVGILYENCQYYYRELHESFDEKMAFSHELGLKNIICAPDQAHVKTVDDWNGRPTS